MSALEVVDLHAGYGSMTVLHGVDLNVDNGHIVGIVGPNGAGKSTLMKAIAKLVRLTAGSVRLRSTDITRLAAHELAAIGLGYVPQERNTFPDLTVVENLRVGLSSLSRSAAAVEIANAYERYPALANRQKQLASTLSGGERQMLAMASALIRKPSVLLLDEPTTGLAPVIVQQIISDITHIGEEGAAVVWVIEEEPLECIRHCHRVHLLQAGVLSGPFAPDDLLGEGRLEELFFSGDPGSTDSHRPEDAPL